MSSDYDFKAVEERWTARWEADRAWAAPRTPERPKRYVLEMFPYPSGDMHVGHAENFTIGDAIARYWTMRGHDVLHPFGYDAFGLPAENAAIDRGIHPREWTLQNIERFTNTCKRLAFTYDWDRSFNTCDPDYYRWNQWLFLRFYDRGLAYRAAAKVNWCPSCRTVLANEQISQGVCWRCDSVPEVRDLEQWFFKTTAYSEELLEGMEGLDWGDAVLTQQRNWIGRSEGAEVTFRISETGDEVPIFTTRPDTLWGVTFFVFAPEHPIAAELARRAGKESDYARFVDEVRRTSEVDRVALKAERRAFDLGATAVNPVNGESVPVFASDYVLMAYGTGAIMAVPAHDQRDFEFARQHSLEVRPVIAETHEAPSGDEMEEAFEEPGVMVNSGPFTGRPSDEGRLEVIGHLEREGLGAGRTQFRLRDWLISRQRYWGTPIPVVYCDGCGTVPVPTDELPVELPEVVEFQPTGGEASPLATAKEWVETSCPSCGGPGRRETDTMDTFVDSSWYFLRYCDARNPGAPFAPDVANAWMPVDQYTGGIEHAVMHLIYARFFMKVLRDMEMVDGGEPFRRLMNHGMITMGGKVMSKSRGNIVEPWEVLDLYGADALRTFLLFIGPPDQDYDWPDEGAKAVVGSYRFLERVWRLVDTHVDRLRGAGSPDGDSGLRRTTHRALRGVTDDFERYAFNTAIAKLMTLQRELQAAAEGEALDADLREGVETLLHALGPIAPYLAEELWERIGGEGSIHKRPWPEVVGELAAVEQVTMVIQVDGKVRDRVEVDAGVSEEDAVAAALASERVQGYLDGGEPARVIARPPKLVNVLTR